MGKDILHRVGNGGHCGCETVSREVLPQVEILEKWTQEPPCLDCFPVPYGIAYMQRSERRHRGGDQLTPCFAITIWCAIKIAHQ